VFTAGEPGSASKGNEEVQAADAGDAEPMKREQSRDTQDVRVRDTRLTSCRAARLLNKSFHIPSKIFWCARILLLYCLIMDSGSSAITCAIDYPAERHL